MNFDASFCAETMSWATGAVARDDKGEFIAATTWFLPHVRTAGSAEIHAIRNGFWLTKRIGCNSLIIESDSSSAVEAVNQQETYEPDVAVITECNQMRADFASTVCDHCFREANEVADALAKHSFNSRCSEFWEGSILILSLMSL